MPFLDPPVLKNYGALLLFLKSLTGLKSLIIIDILPTFNKTSVTKRNCRVENFVEKLSAAVGENLT